MGESVMNNRRAFLKQSIVLSGGLLSTAWPLEMLASKGELIKLTILHTNDVHSRIEPFTSGRNKGMGGAAQRAKVISNIRRRDPRVLLLDSGDILQGTPYFNFFNGEIEFQLMKKMGYDAATLGNHDFDAGIDWLEKNISKSGLNMVCSNYNVSDTVLNKKIQPYSIIHKKPLKIGVFGLGIELKGLVPDKLYKKTVYNDPLKSAENTARLLKMDEKCDLVICLSHLGYAYKENKVSDSVLASSIENIDLILGGHTHTFMDSPSIFKNPTGKKVLVLQSGWAGLRLGRIEYFFEKNRKKNWSYGDTVIIN